MSYMNNDPIKRSFFLIFSMLFCMPVMSFVGGLTVFYYELNFFLLFYLVVVLLFFIRFWYRFIFVLISLEFLIMRVFVKFFEVFNGVVFFFFMCHSVISRILGVVIMVGGVKFYGSDLRIFCRFKLSETINFQN
uniref:Uncharacterized protein n=1 Tax=Angiostrongylus cantonensis TaxID=6313 RepID=A0A0K0D1U8_ANGCA